MAWWETLRGAEPWYSLWLAVFGAIAGSFASAAVWRVPREGESLVRPLRSRCTSCGTTIAWYDNLPVLSWILLRGRCRACGVRYGAGYLVHELVLAGLFLWAGHAWPGRAGLLALGLACCALTALWIAAAIDWRHFILPDGITLGGIPAGFLASCLVPQFQLWPGDPFRLPWGTAWAGLDPSLEPVPLAALSSAVGAAASWGFLFGFRLLFSYILRQEALGRGDVKYLAAVGAWVGLEGSAWTLLVGVMAGALLGIGNILRMILLVRARRRRRGRVRSWKEDVHVGWQLGRVIPFGPPLVLGTILVLLEPSKTASFFTQTWPDLLRNLLA